jgi:RNA polymerase sigma factor for flagellar operon FliA
MSATTEELWTLFCRNPEDPRLKTALLEQYHTFLKRCANNFFYKLPDSAKQVLDLDDFVSEGNIELLKLIDRFKPNLGIKFESYAQYRLLGCFKDLLRKIDPLNRSQRQDIRALKEPGIKIVSIDTVITGDGERVLLENILTDEQDPFKEVLIKEDIEDLLSNPGLSPRERKILTLYYCQNKNNREIALELGSSESRISQQHNEALKFLREGKRTMSEEVLSRENSLLSLLMKTKLSDVQKQIEETQAKLRVLVSLETIIMNRDGITSKTKKPPKQTRSPLKQRVLELLQKEGPLKISQIQESLSAGPYLYKIIKDNFDQDEQGRVIPK